MSTMNDPLKLKVSESNAKIDWFSFNLPAGWTCPGAYLCLAKVDKNTGRVTDGNQAEFRCFAASMETFARSVRDMRWNNLDILTSLKTREEMAKALIRMIQAKIPISNRAVFRIHVSGDFFNEAYFQAWIAVANYFPNTLFYGYTKSLHTWTKFRNNVPQNLRLAASYGSKFDDLIAKHSLRFSKVVFSEEEAANYPLSKYWQKKLGRAKGLKIDHDDSLLFSGIEPFALLLHGTQKTGSKAAEALKAIDGKGDYNKDKKAERWNNVAEIRDEDLRFE